MPQLSWRNGRGGKWTRRIEWHENKHGIVKLKITIASREGTLRVFQKLKEFWVIAPNQEAAKTAYDLFKSGDDLGPRFFDGD